MDVYRQMKQSVSLRDKKGNAKTKDNLIKIITTKLRTAFIGALSQFEENLGYLWGHGKDCEDLTKNEKDFKKIWNKIRDKVLDNGNNQIRAIESEIDLYDIVWNGYQYKFNISNKRGNNAV